MEDTCREAFNRCSAVTVEHTACAMSVQQILQQLISGGLLLIHIGVACLN